MNHTDSQSSQRFRWMQRGAFGFAMLATATSIIPVVNDQTLPATVLFILAVMALATGLVLTLRHRRTEPEANDGSSSQPDNVSQMNPSDTTQQARPSKVYLEGYELEFVFDHAYERRRLYWQPRLPGALVLVVGLLAGCVLWAMNMESWLSVLVFGLAVVVSTLLLLPRGPKWRYKPTEDNLSKGTRKDLMVFRAGERVREGFWNVLGVEERKLREYASVPGLNAIVYTSNFRGRSGKSMFELLIGSVASIFGWLRTFLFPTTANRKTSSATQLAGIDPTRETVLRHSEFTRRRKAGHFKRDRDLWTAITKSLHGVGLLVEDKPNEGDVSNHIPATALTPLPSADGSRQKYNPYPTDDFVDDVDAVRGAVDVLLLDGAQDDNDPDSIPDWAARIATCLVFIANWESAASKDMLRETVRSFYTDQQPCKVLKPGEQPTDGRHYPTSQKVEDAVIILCNVPRGMEITREMFLGLTDGLGSHFLVMYRDPNLYNDDGGNTVKPVDLDTMNLESLLFGFQALNACYRVAAKTLGLEAEIAYIEELTAPKGPRFHPQRQLIDRAGRFIGADTTPTEQSEPTEESPESGAEEKPATEADPVSETNEADQVGNSTNLPVQYGTTNEDPSDRHLSFKPRISVSSGH